MKLHRLRLHAFGPFADTEEIDFDELAAGGLHLIHGPTGAGKTSVLDAICFALFAGVPGGRMQGRDTLRSDHADPTTRPEVELEFGVGERRLRVTRSPEHQVPKKRGTGTRSQRGSVALQELRAGTWQTVSTRADEVAQTMGELLGMGLPQFAQVVLLPQGDFTAFLRAKPDDRGRLLERLFDISDFAAVEHWLTTHRKALETQSIQAHTQRANLVARAREVLSGVAEDPDSDVVGDPLGGLEDDHDAATVLHDHAGKLSDRLTSALAASDAASGAVEQLRSRLAAERSLATLQQYALDARRTLQEVDAQAAELTAAEERLAAAARADRCAPAIAVLERRQHALERACRATVDRRTDLARHSAWSVPEMHHDQVLTETALDPLVESAAAGTEALAGRPEILRQLTTLDGSLRAASDELAAAQRDAVHRRSALDAAETQLAQLNSRRAELAPDAAAHPAWRRLLDDVEEAGKQLDGAIHDIATTATAEQEHRRTQRDWSTAEQEVIRLRIARLTGIAAELADDLVDGEPCPVCGSADHPHAAQAALDHVGADRVETAEATVAAAGRQATAAAARWSSQLGRTRTTCRTALDSLSGLTSSADQGAFGDDSTGDGDSSSPDVLTARHTLAADIAAHLPQAADLAGALEANTPSVDPDLAVVLRTLAQAVSDARRNLTANVARAESAARELVVLEDQLRGFDDERTAAQQAIVTAAEAVRLAQARLATIEAQAADGHARLDEITLAHTNACGCSTADDPSSAHATCVADLERLRAATAEQRSAATEAAAARSELTRLLADAGFDDAESATQATLSEDAQQHLRSQVGTARTSATKATGVLEQPDVARAIEAPAAAVDEIAEDLASAEQTARHAHDTVGEVRRALDKLHQISAELTAHDERTAPLQRDLAVATSLASAVSGAGDNTMRMRLTAYVLAARLESVTALANERLNVMTDGRYQLEHTDQRAARGSKSGLGLRVRDAWTGTTRDTATLSGGESFIASLALALGLGDAVLQAAGGRRLETLLVDEGFGSLDEDSLEQVLDVLDGLRAGGRTVGIVSHVAELRTRIPAQIRVSKTARGSTLQVVTDAVA